MNSITLYDGSTLRGVHAPTDCLGEYCCIHKPSDHPLRYAPLAWMGEIRSMFRVCEHGFFHPDPDDIRFLMGVGQWLRVEAITSVHLMKENCDECCRKEVK